jgi:signal transduction histidine kinase
MGTVKLAEFINSHIEAILAEWEAYARSRAPAGVEFDGTIRDHAAAMLRAIAHDLAMPEQAREQEARSKGLDDAAAPDADEAAKKHGAGRAEYGFSLDQMLSEFRVLRAIVIRQWRESLTEIGPTEFDALKRFDEAIAQTLTTSVSRYIKELDHAKETFLAILGHDLKTPLSAIVMSAGFLLEAAELEEGHRTMVQRIERSGQRMNQMVSDLLDFTRSRLGRGIPIERGDADLERVVHEAVDEARASNPKRTLNVKTAGVLSGAWDAKRISQALTNLISNAIHHGGENSPIAVTATGEEEQVSIAVHNEGPAIPPERVTKLFDPLGYGGAASGKVHDSSHLGIGLHIAKAIVNAHGGSIDVDSSDEAGTTFTVNLPRKV